MRRTPLLLYTSSAGRFGNQLLRFFHWAAWARELDHACAVLNLPFWPYAKLFSEWRRNRACLLGRTDHSWNLLARAAARVPLDPWMVNWKLQRISLRASRHLTLVGVDLLDKPTDERVNVEEPEFVRRALDGRYLVCSGWEFACWNWLERHAVAVRALFAPAPPFGQITQEFMAESRRHHDVLVGLCVRRGDYRNFFDGRFYYSWESYTRWVREAADLYPGKRVGVIITGDETIPMQMLQGLPVHLATGSLNRGGHFLESFLQLSMCDLILGPPSTFAACAAFLGDRPWLPLRSADQTLSRDQILQRPLFEAALDSELALAVR